MKPDIKNAFVKALRSGKYKQTRNQLVTKDGRHCGLGVLCVVTDSKPTEYREGEYFLPTRVRNASGLTYQEEFQIVKMNDLERKTFSQIADAVEAWS